MTKLILGVPIPPQPESTQDAVPQILVLVPNSQGGIRSLFMQMQSGTHGLTHSQIYYFASHDEAQGTIARLPQRFWSFFSNLRARKPDLCHINLSKSGSTLRKVIFAIICRALAIPYVIHLHSGGYQIFFEKLPRPLKWVVRDFFRHAAQVIVLGTVWRDYVAETIGIDLGKITILPNAVFGPDTLPERDVDKTPHILFLGRLGPGKGTPELLEALASPAMQALDWKATLAGDGDVARYKTDADRLGLADRVYFPGWVGPDEAQNLLAEGDILTLPSHAENLPLSMLEGMGYGLCPVVTPVGAVEDVIRDEENGLLVPVGDAEILSEALAKAVSQPELRHRLGDAARADFLAHYDIRDYRHKLEQIYIDVLNRLNKKD